MIKTSFEWNGIKVNAQALWVSPYNALNLKLKIEDDNLNDISKRELAEIEELAIEYLYEKQQTKELEF